MFLELCTDNIQDLVGLVAVGFEKDETLIKKKIVLKLVLANKLSQSVTSTLLIYG